MYVIQILGAWLLLVAFSPTALTQRHEQRRDHRKSELYDEADENEDVWKEPAPPERVDDMQKYTQPSEGENFYMPRPYESVQARMPFNEGFYRQIRDRPSRARRADTFTNADYYNPMNGRHFNEGPKEFLTKNDHINNHNHLQPYENLYPSRAGGYYQQNAAPYSRRLQPYMPNPNMLGTMPYYNRHYIQPFLGLHQNMPSPEEQHMRNQAEPSEDASVELTDSKENLDEDMRKHGGPNAQGFPNGEMLEEQPYYKWKYGKSSEVMHSHMPLAEEESLKSNEEPSVGDSEGDQASEEGENDNMRKGARRYTEDIPKPNMQEEMSLHSLNPMSLRSSEEVVELNQDSEEDENMNKERFSNSTMSDELNHYKGDYEKTSQADQQNTTFTGDESASLESVEPPQADQQNSKTTGDETYSLENAKTSQADQQNTKSMGDEADSLESAETTQADQQNTKTTGDERASLESSTLSIFDTSTAETTPSEAVQSNTTTTELKHIQNETESTTTTKPSRSTAQTTPIDSTQEKTKNSGVTSTQNGTDFPDY